MDLNLTEYMNIYLILYEIFIVSIILFLIILMYSSNNELIE